MSALLILLPIFPLANAWPLVLVRWDELTPARSSAVWNLHRLADPGIPQFRRFTLNRHAYEAHAVNLD